jgi:glucan biosynthesis protein C
MTLPPVTQPVKSRIYYIDWLRVLAMLGIFLFHNARFYDVFSDWHVKNAQTSIGASMLVAFMDQWIMPLFFLLAGASSYLSLSSRNTSQYIQERTFRLLVPFIFGIFIITVPQAYFEFLSHSGITGISFIQFFPDYILSLPILNWYHLWFLIYLFVFSLIALPIFFHTKPDTSILSRLALLIRKHWVLPLLLFIPLALIDIFINPGGFWGQRNTGGWNIGAYFLFFLAGYLIFCRDELLSQVRKMGRIVPYLAVITAVILVLFFIPQLSQWAEYFGTLGYDAAQSIQALGTWCWLILIFNLGIRYLNMNNRFLAYANEAVLPFYILHQTVIITIGYYVVQWNIDIALKYLIIASTSFIVIMAVYELLVRRFNVLRFLFGMKIKKTLKTLLVET